MPGNDNLRRSLDSGSLPRRRFFREEIRSPLKTPAGEAMTVGTLRTRTRRSLKRHRQVICSQSASLCMLGAKLQRVFFNTAAKRLRMRQVEHFRSLFQSHFPVRSKSPARVRIHSVCSLWFSSSASCCSCF